MIENKLEKAALEKLRTEVTDFLFGLVAIRSYPNEEQEAAQYCYDAFSKINGTIVRRLPMDNSLMDDPLWCPGPLRTHDYTGHFNVEIVWKGSGAQAPIYINAHLDTVTASEEDRDLLAPVIKDGILYGLGACDDKGSVAAIYTVFKLLSMQNVQLPFDVVGHLVCEEEIGGNGALAVTRDRSYQGQAVIVLEPTYGCIYPTHRCGLWVKLTCHGASCHTAAIHTGKGISAFHLFLKAYAALETVHSAYREECRKCPPLHYEGYVPPLNVGMVHLGDWPSKVPPVAVAYASVAVLPNSSNREMKARILEAFRADEELRTAVDCEFVFDRECSVGDFDSDFVRSFAACVKANGYSGEITPQKALSDMYFYQEVLGIPTVTFGPGNGMHAHSSTEQIALVDVLRSANAIHDWLLLAAGGLACENDRKE